MRGDAKQARRQRPLAGVEAVKGSGRRPGADGVYEPRCLRALARLDQLERLAGVLSTEMAAASVAAR